MAITKCSVEISSTTTGGWPFLDVQQQEHSIRMCLTHSQWVLFKLITVPVAPKYKDCSLAKLWYILTLSSVKKETPNDFATIRWVYHPQMFPKESVISLSIIFRDVTRSKYGNLSPWLSDKIFWRTSWLLPTLSLFSDSSSANVKDKKVLL